MVLDHGGRLEVSAFGRSEGAGLGETTTLLEPEGSSPSRLIPDFFSMGIPDFFIAGAPKCGTTALFSYLQSHPGIFLPEAQPWVGAVAAKEPHYFCTDFPNYRRCRALDDYLRLFAPASAGTLIGEASVWYLYSEVAIPQIMQRNPRARFIVLLRNPVDMAHSLHNQLYHTLDEDIADFERAWHMQARRAQGQGIPRHCREPKHLLYEKVCSFSHQLERLFKHVPREQCLVIIADEFGAAPEQTYVRALEFLGLAPDHRDSFPRVNSSATNRSRLLTVVLRSLPRRMKPLYRMSKAIANSVGLRPGSALSRWNRREQSRPPLDAAFRRQLLAEFASEVDRVEQLLDRRLDLWREPSDISLSDVA
jgi:Sulfotransferase family